MYKENAIPFAEKHLVKIYSLLRNKVKIIIKRAPGGIKTVNRNICSFAIHFPLSGSKDQ